MELRELQNLVIIKKIITKFLNFVDFLLDIEFLMFIISEF